MAGNLCRCGAYPKIERAILRASGGALMPRLVKTQREMEGRFEDVWALVDEDDELETWADDAELARRRHGRRTRQDGPLRAGGRARYTVDVQLPGMLHAAVLRSPRRALPRHGARPRRGPRDARRARGARAGRPTLTHERRPAARRAEPE